MNWVEMYMILLLYYFTGLFHSGKLGMAGIFYADQNQRIFSQFAKENSWTEEQILG